LSFAAFPGDTLAKLGEPGMVDGLRGGSAKWWYAAACTHRGGCFHSRSTVYPSGPSTARWARRRSL